MDQRPIGIFDSGVGGLSAVRVLLDQAPEENIAYFGDTARVPYGNRSRAEITTLSLQDVRFLQSRKPKAILIACNTITASCLEDLRQANPATPILGVIEAAALAAAQATTNRRESWPHRQQWRAAPMSGHCGHRFRM
ncbi:MAG: aspartate/glutamate racemase family protein [Lachnospiraceae bacterium]|nr:aspartate/glutamate racemase family protein [Lachnospiraceae bacterium]